MFYKEVLKFTAKGVIRQVGELQLFDLSKNCPLDQHYQMKLQWEP